MKLTDDVYLVGGGDYGFNLTHRLDCHTYPIDGGDELALVDAGFGPGTTPSKVAAFLLAELTRRKEAAAARPDAP